MTQNKAQPPHHHNHRQRLRQRFLKDMGDNMADYELLEFLLCHAIPRRDVKPLAKSLLQKYGSLSAVLAASPAQLKEFPMMGETSIALFKLTREISLRQLKQEILEETVLSSWQAVKDYCRISMAHETVEQLRVLHLNNRNKLILDEITHQGTVDHTPLYPREVAKRALELGTTAIILVHNHPSGDATPSGEDIQGTKKIKDVLKNLDIALHDHIIIAGQEVTSMKALGLI